MKKIILLLPIMLLLFTGCSLKQPMSYDSEKVSSNLNANLSKVENKTITIYTPEEEQNKIINKYLKGRTFGVSIDMEVGKINSNIAKQFMNQYFKDVQIKNSKNSDDYITIESNISNYEWDRFFPDIIHIDADIEIKAYLKDKLVISKTYRIRDYDSSVLLVFGNFTLIPLIQETFHKAILDIYENQFKPDLLKALEENM